VQVLIWPDSTISSRTAQAPFKKLMRRAVGSLDCPPAPSILKGLLSILKGLPNPGYCPLRFGNLVSFPRRRSSISMAKNLIVVCSFSLKVLKKISTHYPFSLKILKNHLNRLQDFDHRLFVITESIEKDITTLFVITESIEKVEYLPEILIGLIIV
jgi:hypothetical protein